MQASAKLLDFLLICVNCIFHEEFAWFIIGYGFMLLIMIVLLFLGCSRYQGKNHAWLSPFTLQRKRNNIFSLQLLW